MRAPFQLNAHPLPVLRAARIPTLSGRRVCAVRCAAGNAAELSMDQGFGAFDEVLECPHLRNKLKPR
jgi:hypothetical protein